ncbi:SpvB/TcaC N-terminal domain-containing protein [Marinomonas mediterranea]|uniref:SpvB/TcaC N-terminal domain-containing protein n=1 Tax=Marinomonas mediterranea TaxID=119864 RepID=UPI00234A72C2|nr:SpvB/TcaC N-terminal domain-containing protein [Marinomonas mediterranea]WCN10209.1 hypothetical protein GV055_15475 [Marinomonas mediterranea]
MRTSAVRIVLTTITTALFLLFARSAFSDTLVGSIPGEAGVSPSGAATYTIPIEVPPGINGLQPNLALNYNSQRGNGLLGVGWALTGLSEITRCNANMAQDGFIKAVNFNNDRFCLDGQKLKVVSGAYGSVGAEYRPESNPNLKVVSVGGSDGAPEFWKVVASNGHIYTYGDTSDSKLIANGKHAGSILEWALRSVTDIKNNSLSYKYKTIMQKGNLQLVQISYSDYTIHLDYIDSKYRDISFSADSQKISSHVLSKIHWGSKLETYFLFSYNDFSSASPARLDSIKRCVDTQCLPTSNFSWQKQGQENSAIKHQISDWGYNDRRWWVDFDGDGRSDYCRAVGASSGSGSFIACALSTGTGIENTQIPMSDWGYSDRRWWVDFNGDGRTDYCRAVGASSGSGSFIACALSTGTGIENIQIPMSDWGYSDRRWWVDFNGDGRSDYCRAVGASSGSGSFIACALSTGTGIENIQIPMSDWGYSDRRWWVDFNGDGRSDYCRAVGASSGSGSFIACALSTGTGVENIQIPMSDWGYSDRRWWVDFNGDGRSDYCRAVGASSGSGSFIACALSAGTSLQNTQIPMRDWGYSDRRWWVDFNGDGRSDYCRAVGASTGSGSFIACALSTGTNIENAQISMSDWGYSNRRWWVKINGENNSSYCRAVGSSTGSNSFVSCQSITTENKKANILSAIFDGKGVTTAFNYNKFIEDASYTSQYPTLTSPIKSPVVSKYTIKSSYNIARSISYKFSRHLINKKTQSSLGFEKITRTDEQTGIVTETTYSQDWENRTTGMPVQVVSKLGDIELTRTATQYNTEKKSGTFFSYPKTSTTVKKDLNDLFTSTQSIETSYDLFGSDFNYQISKTTECVAESNPFLSNTPKTCNQLSGKINQTETHYTYYADGQFANRPPMLKRQTTTSEVFNGQLPFGQDNRLTRTQQFDYYQNGQLKTKTQEPDNAALKAQTEYKYNGRGQLASTTLTGADIAARTTSLSYNDEAPYQLTSTTNALNQTEHYRYEDSRFPWLATSTTAIDGQVASVTYDSFGRKATQSANNQTTSWDRTWCDSCDGVSGAQYKITQSSTLTTDTVQYFNANNQLIETHTQGLKEGKVETIIQKVEYDELGRETKSYSPYYVSDGLNDQQVTVKEYDVLNRVIKETFPNGNQRFQHFNERETRVELVTTDGTREKQEIRNALGQITQTIDHNGETVDFQYDALGSLVQTTDSSSNQVQLGYDLLGRKTQMNDPDMGEWSYTYYLDGKLKSQTDALGQTTTFTYDALGRMKERHASDTHSYWTYDSCANGVGKLCSMQGNGKTERYIYTTQGQLDRTITSIDGDTYEHTNQYDQYARLTSTRYPTGYTASTHYHPTLGFADKITNGSNVLWETTGFDARGMLKKYAMNNGALTTEKGYRSDIENVESIDVKFNNNGLLYYFYNWNKLGNLSNKVEYFSNVNVGYTYDNLSRLTAYTTSIAGSSHNSVSMQYDALGNITQKTDVGDYTYGQNPCGIQAGPHAVTSITGKGNYCYDANGNMTSGDGRTFQYTSFNKPNRISKGSEVSTFTYGPDQARFKKVNTGTVASTTYYIGAYEKEIRDGHTYHRIQLGDFAIVEKVDSNAEKVTYTLRDDLNTLIATVSETGEVKRLFYDPWGKRMDLPTIEDAQPIDIISLANFGINRGFTNHEHLDNVGLIHMNGRVYDPEIARFTSADPLIQKPTYLQSYNRYSYVWNNPLRYTDPSGFETEGKSTWDRVKDAVKKAWDRIKKWDRKNQRIAREKKRDAMINRHVYGKGGHLPEGVSPVSAQELIDLGLEDIDFLHDKSGFKSRLYYDSIENEYIYAFAGTETGKDWVNNFQQGLGKFSKQYDLAIRNTRKIARTLSKGTSNFSLTGHSLGGGLASAASVVHGIKATTFNAAGVTEDTIKNYGGNIHEASQLVKAYYVEGEILSSLQDTTPLASALGVRISLPPTHNLSSIWGTPASVFGASTVLQTNMHGMDSVIKALDTVQ